jgi:hypothetical protein
VAVLGRYQIA